MAEINMNEVITTKIKMVKIIMAKLNHFSIRID